MKQSLFIACLSCILGFAPLSTIFAQQEEDLSPLQVGIKTIVTDFQQEAISLGIDYVRSLDSMFRVKDILIAQNKSLFQLTPSFNVQTGTEDAFSSIQLKISGIFMTFRTTYVAGFETPDLTKGFQTFPLSLGVETNSKFNIINGIAEAGWVPWYAKRSDSNAQNPFRTIKFGLFVQSGYKFRLDSLHSICPNDSLDLCNGNRDESSEEANKFLLRAKGSFKMSTNNLVNLGNTGLGLSGHADGWYDIANKVWYYRAEASLRFYFSRKGDKYFDLAYQKGSGAPNFNTGDQFGLGLTVGF